MNSPRPELRIDWCTNEAAAHACMVWHYSKAVPKSKLVKVGVWEGGTFRGAVIFGSGANKDLGACYGLSQFETCELVRVALHDHATEVTRIVRIALRFLKCKCPGLRLVVSFADPERGHHGGIYQGGNWIYAGMTEPADEYIVRGKRIHGRSLRISLSRFNVPGKNTLERARTYYRDPAARLVAGSSKHRYLMPLDDEIRAKVMPLAQPYPKRAKQATDVHHAAGGGAAPTRTLQPTPAAL